MPTFRMHGAAVAAFLVRWVVATPAPAQVAPTAALRLPAFTAYLLPDADAERIGPNRPVVPFAKAGRTLAWYGHIATTGSLRPMLQLTLPASDTARLTLTVGATVLPAITVRGSGAPGSRHLVGLPPITLRDTGYLRLTLTSDRPTTAVIDALLLDGDATAGAHFNTEARRNAASVHLRYATDSAAPITGFYSEVTAVDDPIYSYYMATGFARGYFGMQVNSPTERRIIFSVWDAAEGQTAMNRSTVAEDNRTSLIGKGEGVVAEVFGNEGTGGHSHLVYPWKTGSVQRFFVTAAPVGTATEYRGYWFHPDTKRWMLIAGFKAPKDGGYLRRLYAFSENFGGSNGHLRRKARYGNQWLRFADGSWRELTSATFTHDPTGRSARLDRFAGVEDGQFFLSHGGFGQGFALTGASVTRPATSRPPEIVLPPE
jgi:hypothetical protein